MASMRDIQRRKNSVRSTGQITRAMKLVATVKLQKARSRAESAKPYFDEMYKTVKTVLARSGTINHRYLQQSDNPDAKKAVIILSSNRGLAGGYNSNMVKLITNNEAFTKDNTVIYSVGTKARDALVKRGYSLGKDFSDVMEQPIYRDAMDICQEVLKAFEAGEIGEIYIAYTFFKNTVSHIPTLLKLLPVDKTDEEVSAEDSKTLMNFEPEEDEVLDVVIPKYMSSIIFGALIQAVASENGARMAAMDSATSNAEEMIEDLSLKYNRARQSSITNELTEIIAGADALG